MENTSLRPEIIALARTGYFPQVEPGEGGPMDSRFSGSAWLPIGVQWPTCANCHKPMQHFLQLNSETIPEPLHGRFGKGLLHLFYCTNMEDQCEQVCEAWAPFAKSVATLRVDLGSPGRLVQAPIPDAYPPQAITGWQPVEDVPHLEDLEEDYAFELTEEEEQFLEEAESPHPGDKLWGWPCWVQGPEYPECTRCGERMKLIFQIDSDVNLPYMFGDAGCGHLTGCADHPDVLAFGWACG